MLFVTVSIVFHSTPPGQYLRSSSLRREPPLSSAAEMPFCAAPATFFNSISLIYLAPYCKSKIKSYLCDGYFYQDVEALFKLDFYRAFAIRQMLYFLEKSGRMYSLRPLSALELVTNIS